MRSAGPITSLRAMAVAAAVLFVPAPAVAAAAPEPPPAASRTEVTISPVDLDGPAVAAVKVTVKNAYRIFAHLVPLDAAKQVEFVVLPSNGNIHVFDMAIAP
ncbi:hypothetical protein [Streptomyces peucetius]